MDKIDYVLAFTFISVALCFVALTAHEITSECKEPTTIIIGE